MLHHHKTIQQTLNPDIYHTIQNLTDHTKRMALEHNFPELKKSMNQIEKIYKQGTAPVKSAVENIFIFSLSSIICSCNIVEWRILQSYMPSSLYTLYINQILKSKC